MRKPFESMSQKLNMRWILDQNFTNQWLYASFLPVAILNLTKQELQQMDRGTHFNKPRRKYIRKNIGNN